ncbi:MAG TPA: hypothetical protein VNZ64_27125 [Candidatus Acidoferrum sp.]|jgi:hypothetical protein|nr:hypothetical protein [Candidatus Acidoferrum sp.]
MVPATTTFILFFGLCAGMVAAAWVLTLRLTPERKRGRIARWLLSWSLKGLVAPLTIWALMNVGISWNLQPFMPEVQVAQNSGVGWAPEFLHVLANGLFILSSYWMTATLAWVLVSAGRAMDGEPRKDFKALCRICALGLSIPALVLLLLGGWLMLGVAGALLLVPMAGYAPALLNPQKLPPMYARAVARMKFGKYNEAELEIIRELEKCEDDFEGWMMLAGLYADHFHDLAEAERTVLEICDQPRITPTQLSIALHRLADWHLKLGGNPAAAHRSLQIVCDRLRGSHLARMAGLRINQLPRTAEDLREQQSVKPIPLPALGDRLDEPSVPAEGLDRTKAAHAANACVERLKQEPNNVPARERLARLFAEGLERADLGLEQIGLLLDMPGQPENRRAEWLGLMGAWQIRYQHDLDAGRRLLERLIQEYPESPQAFAARRRLRLLEAPSQQRLGDEPSQ